MTEPWEEACELIVHDWGNWDLSNDQIDAMSIIISELRAAKAENEKLKNELSKCAWHGAFEEYEEDIRKLREENERLKERITLAKETLEIQ